MEKNKLFIFSSILIFISLFAAAATCNFCGVPIDIGEEQQEESEEDTEVKAEKTPAKQEADTKAEPEETKTENHAPVIEKVLLGGMDARVMEATGMLDEVPSGLIIDEPFEINAFDEDGDQLEYIAYDSLGKDLKVEKIDNDLAILNWDSPDHIGPYELTIEVSDGKGGIDTYTISMTIVGQDEPPPAEEGGEIL